MSQWTPWGEYFKYPQSIEKFVCHHSWNDLAKFSEILSNLPTQQIRSKFSEVSFSKWIRCVDYVADLL